MNKNGASFMATEAAFKKQAGTIEKLLKGIKKLLAKEFLWIFAIVLVSFPMTLIHYYLLTKYGAVGLLNALHEIFEDSGLFLGLYSLNVIGLYFSRTLLGAIKTLSKAKK